jgi:hypothetical protein
MRKEATMTDPEMVGKILQLANYYAGGGQSVGNPQLVQEVMEISRALNSHGGTTEMRRVFALIPPIPGKQTIEKDWAGIGDWPS